MKNNDFGGHRESRHRSGNIGKEHSHHRGAKTFRRGRAIAFLERLKVKRATIMEQLDKPEFQSIQQVLVGELKAIDMMMNEFSQLFEIEESEVMETPNKKKEDPDETASKDRDCLVIDEKGTKRDETN
ncbi:hypothetical protein R4Z09_18125 [Niallia oryzisoli]|uniref:Uncharacterized protein n=1 Tax=Niallia oryzisoli TaxID=1737571 RepID=A0ABZ2C871_9BACI